MRGECRAAQGGLQMAGRRTAAVYGGVQRRAAAL
jgi:hypothetical protein